MPKYKTKLKLIILFTLGLVFLTPQKIKAQTILFEDNFSDGDANSWIVVGSPGWNVQNEEYGIFVNPGTSNTLPADALWNYSWKNITFEVDLRGVQGVDKNILIKFKDTSNFIEIHHNDRGIFLEKASTEGGAFRVDTPYHLQNGITYHFKIEVDGQRIRVWVDNNLLFDAIDTFPMFDTWKIGLRIGTGGVPEGEVWYDNVVVRELPETTPIPIPSPSPTISPTPIPTPTPFPTTGPFELPFNYPGRLSNNPVLFRVGFWKRLTAAFDHVFRGGLFRPFIGDAYVPKDCPQGTVGISCYDGHNGTDFSAFGGQDVFSVAMGKVVYTSVHTPETCIPEKGGFGCVAIIEYPESLYGLYAHLDKIFVTDGNLVSSSVVLGEMGKTGCPSCGKHLHFGVMRPTATSFLLTPMTKSHWRQLLYTIKPTTAPRYKPFCTYNAPNGIRFTFQDPAGWFGNDTDPWSLSRELGGCGITSRYLWKYSVN